MSNSRGNNYSGTFFITSVTYQRKPYFSDEQLAELILSQWTHYEKAYEFRIDAYCVMPDHYLVVLHKGEDRIVSQFAHAVNSYSATMINQHFANDRKVKIWGRRPWYIEIRDEDMCWEKVAYTLFNPWRGGLVEKPFEQYRFSNMDEWLQREGEEFLLDLFSKHKRWFE
jgi:putative transposase